MKTYRQFDNSFEDVVRTLDAIDTLVIDNAQIENTGWVKDIHCVYTIGNWCSEPHQQQQNPGQ